MLRKLILFLFGPRPVDAILSDLVQVVAELETARQAHAVATDYHLDRIEQHTNAANAARAEADRALRVAERLQAITT